MMPARKENQVREPNQDERLGMSVPETAKRLKIGRNQAYAAVKTGELPSVRIGRRIIIPWAALRRRLEGKK